MEENFMLALVDFQKQQALAELGVCNTITSQYGLSLSAPQLQALVENRFQALADTGRVEFGEGILKKLIEAFCDSPYLLQIEYQETLTELQDAFYFFKSESHELISDDELISYMKKHFDDICQGSTEALFDMSIKELCQDTRYEYQFDDPDDPDSYF